MLANVRELSPKSTMIAARISPGWLPNHAAAVLTWVAASSISFPRTLRAQSFERPFTIETNSDSVRLFRDRSGDAVAAYLPNAAAVVATGFYGATLRLMVTHGDLRGWVSAMDIGEIRQGYFARPLPELGQLRMLRSEFDTVVQVFSDPSGGAPSFWPENTRAWIVALQPGSPLIQVAAGRDSAWVHYLTTDSIPRVQRETGDPLMPDEWPEVLNCPTPGSPHPRERGLVILQGVLTVEGSIDPTSVVVLRADRPRLAELARDAFLRCRFRPGTIRGRVVEALIVQPYGFGVEITGGYPPRR
jgi:hypothetical protein